MKKILATAISLCLCFGFCNRVYAFTPADLEPIDVLTPADLEPIDKRDVITSDVYEQTASKGNDFESVSNMLKRYCLMQYEESGEKALWTISSLNNHQKVQYNIFKNQKSDDYEKMVNTIDENLDFVQIATLMDNELLNTVKESFEKDAVETSLELILPVDKDYKKVYTDLKESNIPIYWNIEESNTDVFVIEIAIGKYIIQPGDTLSQIALNYNTSVEKILKDNKNIENPDLIYAYDYLTIK